MMIQQNIFRGEKVRLVAIDIEKMAQMFVSSGRDSEFSRLLDTSPARMHSKKATKKWMEDELLEPKPTIFPFMIHTLDSDHLIGEIGLYVDEWSHRDAFVGIGVINGYRDQGYGTDAMRLVLHYAFTELNLARVSLDVFEYNPRAIRSYEKAGFMIEGRQRDFINREGKRYDLIYMGILYDEWKKNHAG